MTSLYDDGETSGTIRGIATCPNCSRKMQSDTCYKCGFRAEVTPDAPVVPVVIVKKVCMRCNRSLPTTYFDANSKYADGLTKQCRECLQRIRNLRPSHGRG